MTSNTPSATEAPFTVRVLGDVQHRIGDGALETIPVGKTVEVSEAIATMVLSWEEEGNRINAVLAKQEFEHYIESGALSRD